MAQNEKDKNAAESQIREQRKPIDYDTKEYPVETLVQKYEDDKDKNRNELFIPDYQRELAWDEKRQSKFIESVLLGLPIPYIFVADVYEPGYEPGNEGLNEARLEIVDGTQRIRTLANFLNGSLKLQGLEKLPLLNGFYFQDFPLSRQRRFKRTTLRMIQLTEKADEEVRRDMFERINTGSVELNDMEKRRGIRPGPFLELIKQLAGEQIFQELCPFSDALKKRREPEEYALRFFAYLNNYEKFERNVNTFIDSYLEEKNNDESLNEQGMKDEFMKMLEFVKKYYPNGFKKSGTAKRIYRVRFESIAVGTALALRQNADVVPTNVNWLDSDKFRDLTTSDGSNSRPRVIARIEYVRNQLLGEV